jgi:hypothetical protein
MRLYRDEVLDFWREEPGEKARLAAQAVRMLWTPFPVESDESGSGLAHDARRTVEPAYMTLLYLLALGGFLIAPRHFTALALLLLSYNTFAAMVFAGSVRYRAPWDFLLALLAAFALTWLWERLQGRRAGYGPSAAR